MAVAWFSDVENALLVQHSRKCVVAMILQLSRLGHDSAEFAKWRKQVGDLYGVVPVIARSLLLNESSLTVQPPSDSEVGRLVAELDWQWRRLA